MVHVTGTSALDIELQELCKGLYLMSLMARLVLVRLSLETTPIEIGNPSPMHKRVMI